MGHKLSMMQNILIIYFIMLSQIFLLFCTGYTQDIIVSKLSCEYLTDPIGIDIANPRLSWKLFSEEKGQRQTAYQVIVATTSEKLKANNGDLWDSGKIISNRSIQIVYEGKELTSSLRCYWKARVWDKDGVTSNWSKIAYWEMGLLDADDWNAKWIGTPSKENNNSLETDPAPYLRKIFTLQKPVNTVRAYVCGLGYYELYLNGKKVGDHVLTPNQTNYDHRDLNNLLYPFDNKMATRVLYETYEITEYLNDSENVAGMILGNGWYNQRDRTAEGYMWYGTPRAILQINVEFEDGTRQMIVSDETWKFSTGPIIHDGIFTGEIYDARLELEGWSKTDYDDSAWKHVLVKKAPQAPLRAQMSPPDKIIRTIKPISKTNHEKGTIRYDFGEMISGWAQLKVTGKEGTKISLRFIEEFGKDYRQKDVYICKGKGLEIYEPRFTWHAFRVVEVIGSIGEFSIKDLEVRVVNSAVEPNGKFECSNKLFNKILENYNRTHLGNMHGSVSSDCPHRERLGYTGDATYLTESAEYNFDMASFFTKWLNDIKDAQNFESGFVPHTAPFGGGGGGPGWGSAYIFLPWFMYTFYDDTQVLKTHYSGMKHWVEYLGTRTDKNGLVIKEEPGAWCLGDWATPDEMVLPPALVNTCIYARIVKIMEQIAIVLGEAGDATHFSDLFKKIKRDLNEAFFDRETGSYSIGWQGANVIPLAFNLVPEDYIDRVLENLIKNIKKNKGHLDTGIIATPLMLDILTKYGREDVAYTIMNQRDYPGYGYAIKQGATTLWEYWDGKLSHSHPMYGSVCRWFFQSIVGINPDLSSPGFKNIIIKPNCLLGDLTYAKAEYNSRHGLITSSWKREKNDLFLVVQIPVNTTATVYLPAVDVAFITESGKSIITSESIKFIGVQDNKAQIEVESGKYRFVSHNISGLVKKVPVCTPNILPEDTIFYKPEAAIITIGSDTEGATIYYTLDGSEPTINSFLYQKPFKLYEKSLVKAVAFNFGYEASYTKEMAVEFVDPKVNGLSYTVYEGMWDKRPDVELLKPVNKGKTYEINVQNISKREDHVAIILKGYIDILTQVHPNVQKLTKNGTKIGIKTVISSIFM
jgi:alpha-L-rhamnosidase